MAFPPDAALFVSLSPFVVHRRRLNFLFSFLLVCKSRDNCFADIFQSHVAAPQRDRVDKVARDKNEV